jgi:hypothetical protein
LLFVLAVLVWVTARQTSAHVTARALEERRTERSVVEAQKAALMRRIREAQSRAVLIPRAESLGLRMPADSEIVMLEGPSTRDR